MLKAVSLNDFLDADFYTEIAANIQFDVIFIIETTYKTEIISWVNHFVSPFT